MAEGSWREEGREGADIFALEIPPLPQGFLFGASYPFDHERASLSFAWLLEAVMFLIPGVRGLHRRGLEEAGRGQRLTG